MDAKHYPIGRLRGGANLRMKRKFEDIGLIDAEYWNNNTFTIGIDEAGRGSIAGPMTIGVVCFLMHDKQIISNLGIRDSKRLYYKRRLEVEAKIRATPALIKTRAIRSEQINGHINSGGNINVLFDRHAAELINSAIGVLKGKRVIVLVDGDRLIEGVDKDLQVAKPRLDATSWTVAAASVLAKNLQVAEMRGLHNKYPNYDFDKNNGYGVPGHIKAIGEFGTCPEHRKGWIKDQWLENKSEPKVSKNV